MEPPETPQPPGSIPPPPEHVGFLGPEPCYRHPSVVTGVRCTRCSRPICPSCMNPAAVGYQCPDCVAQARKEFRRGPGARARRARSMTNASVTQILIVANLAMFVIEILVGGSQMLGTNPSGEVLVRLGAMDPRAIAQGEYWRLFTAMFLHAGVIHIAFNMYALYLFGPYVERAFGRVKFAALYFVTGFVASAASYALSPLYPFQCLRGIGVCWDGAGGVGASGAIVGVFGVFIAYNWRRRDTAMGQANLRTAVMLIFLNVVLNVTMSNLDWRAHLGGLLAGVAAGLVADAPGSRSSRQALLMGGFAGLIAIGLGLVVWRTTTFPL